MAKLADLRDAACAGVDTELFFNQHTAKVAREMYCEGCPVREACLEVAVAFEMEMAEPGELPKRFGSWGGVSATDRRSLTLNNLPTTAADRSQARGAA